MWIISKPFELYYKIASIALDLGHIVRYKSDTALMNEHDDMLSDEQTKELDEFKNNLS